MGYFFTLLFIVTAYLTPTVLFGSLGYFHVEVIIISLAILTSIPAAMRSGLGKTPQLLAFAGMSFTIIFGFLKMGWLGGAATALYDFQQPCFVFFLVAINCRTRRHLQWIILGLFLGSVYFMVQGIVDLHNGVLGSEFIYGDGDLRRIRGLGFVNDPNDFAQVMVSLIPALFLWRKKSLPANILLIWVPIAILLVGMFYTHSRGASLALVAVVVVAGRRKIGTIPAAVIAGLLLAGTFAVGWSGGRDVSMDGGADRLDLWYAGLDIIKAHPFFGIGLGGFADANGLTAHNSVIICAAETGMIGLFFWVMLLFSTFRDGILLGRTGKVVKKDEFGFHPLAQVDIEQKEAVEPVAALERPDSHGAISGFTQAELSFDSIREMEGILIVSLTGFLVAAWFLSRTYSTWLFMYCGMMFAVGRMGAERGLVVKKDGMGFLLGWIACITCGLVILVSLMVRSRNF